MVTENIVIRKNLSPDIGRFISRESPWIRKNVFWFPSVSVCLCVLIFAALKPDSLDGFYPYSVLKSLSVISPCMVNMKQGLLKWSFKNKRAILSKTALTILIEFQWFMETISLNKISYVVFSENNGTHTKAPNAKCRFCLNCFIDQTDLNVVRCSVTNNGLPNENLFRYQNHTDKVNCLYITVLLRLFICLLLLASFFLHFPAFCIYISFPIFSLSFPFF
jgi:hypothetical protein